MYVKHRYVDPVLISYPSCMYRDTSLITGTLVICKRAFASLVLAVVNQEAPGGCYHSGYALFMAISDKRLLCVDACVRKTAA